MAHLVTGHFEQSGNIVTASLPLHIIPLDMRIIQKEPEMDIMHATIAPAALPSAGSPAAEDEARLRATAVKLEAQFLSEMLKHAGFDGPESDFSGGSGEDQFGSFLRDAQATRMAEAGGVGLAETIFRALQARSS